MKPRGSQAGHSLGVPKVTLLCLSSQARWAFVNPRQNLLTRFQGIHFTYHFEVEQQVQGHFNKFFGFNGTAGVWRIQALQEAGSWNDRTTVEDMVRRNRHSHEERLPFMTPLEEGSPSHSNI